MFLINRLVRIVPILLVLGVVALQLPAKSRRTADRYTVEGQRAETLKQWDRALELYEKALAEAPGDVSRMMAVRRVRFQAAQVRVDLGQRLRQEGKLEEAMAEFQQASSIDRSSSIAVQEIHRTKAIIAREKLRKSPPEERGLTPVEQERKAAEARVASTEGVPELRPICRQPISLRMNNQPPRVVFETVGKLAGINVILDPEFNTMGAPRPINVELNNTTLEDALDYVAILTKSFWKPLSANTILVTQDNPTKRKDHENMVARVFYVTNVTTAQDLNEIASAVRTITDIRRVQVCAAQYAIIVRGEVDKVALAEKIIRDMDKPKSEVVVDILVMQASRSRSRTLTAALTNSGTAGISIPVSFSPRNGTTTSTTDSTTSTTTTTTTMTLANIGKLSTSDYSLTMPDALLELLMTDSGTRILQTPQVRAIDGQKASLRIGEKQPFSSGGVSTSTSTSSSTTGLYTSITYIDVGVNVDITPKIHGTDEVSMHVEVEISSVKERIEVAGISEPVISQNKVIHDIRLREGEVNLLGGLAQVQHTKAVAGIPGLSSIPILKRLFSSDTATDSDSELMIALIPHIVRSQDLAETNLKEVATGTDTVFRLRYAPKTGIADSGAPTAPAAPVVVGKPPVTTAPALPSAPAGPPKLSFSPETVETQAGAQVSLRLDLANAPDLFDAPLKIRFDPKILRLNEVNKGSLFEGDGRRVLFTRNIRNDSGEVTINLSRLPDAGGISASGSLLVLNFQTLGRGAAKVAVSEIHAKDSKGQPLELAAPEVVVQVK